ncbi:unnamed protein product, partial [Sphagnum balticum]
MVAEVGHEQGDEPPSEPTPRSSRPVAGETVSSIIVPTSVMASPRSTVSGWFSHPRSRGPRVNR